MVFGLLLGISALPIASGALAVPTVTGVGKGVGSASSDSKRTAELGKNCRLRIFCATSTPSGREIHGRYVGLTNGVAIVQSAHAPPSLPFTGFYISYPSAPTPPTPLGLVTMIAENPPAMGWLYADRHSYELRYGNKSASIEHVFGPWDMCEDELGVTLEGREGVVAVEVEKGTWQLYYDREGNGEGLPAGKKVEVSLEREVVEGEREEEPVTRQKGGITVQKEGGCGGV